MSCGYLKANVYKDNPRTLDELKAKNNIRKNNIKKEMRKPSALIVKNY